MNFNDEQVSNGPAQPWNRNCNRSRKESQTNNSAPVHPSWLVLHVLQRAYNLTSITCGYWQLASIPCVRHPYHPLLLTCPAQSDWCSYSNACAGGLLRPMHARALVPYLGFRCQTVYPIGSAFLEALVLSTAGRQAEHWAACTTGQEHGHSRHVEASSPDTQQVGSKQPTGMAGKPGGLKRGMLLTWEASFATSAGQPDHSCWPEAAAAQSAVLQHSTVGDWFTPTRAHNAVHALPVCASQAHSLPSGAFCTVHPCLCCWL